MEVAALEPIEPENPPARTWSTGLPGKRARRDDPARRTTTAGADWLAERTKLPIVVPFTVGGDEQAKDLFSLFDDTVQRLLKAQP